MKTEQEKRELLNSLQLSAEPILDSHFEIAGLISTFVENLEKIMPFKDENEKESFQSRVISNADFYKEESGKVKVCIDLYDWVDILGITDYIKYVFFNEEPEYFENELLVECRKETFNLLKNGEHESFKPIINE